MKIYSRLLGLLLIVGLAHAQWHMSVLWDRSGEAANSYYGMLILKLGDQNGDGYADWGVFASTFGYLEFFHGGNPLPGVPYRVIRSDTAHGVQLLAANVLGDLNGNGQTDWATWTRHTAIPSERIVSIFMDGMDDNVPELELHSTEDEAIYAMGDFNGDGFDDLYRYYWRADSGQVLYGGSPMDTIPDLTFHSPPEHRYQAWPDAFGDLNGDGYSDFISSTPIPENLLHIFHGGTNPDTVPVAVWTNYSDYPTAIVNDFDRNGRDELITVANPRLNLHWGAQTISQMPDDTLFFFGCPSPDQIASAGDVNRDGYQDMLVVSWFCYSQQGKLALYLGGVAPDPEPVLEILGRTDPLNLIGIGTAIGLGDVNGDGTNDFAIGSWNEDTFGLRGRCVILSGDSTLAADTPPAVPDEFSVLVYPNPFNSVTTFELHLPPYTREAQLTVVNVLGQEVFTEQLHPTTGTLRYAFDGSRLASGLYFLRAQTGKSYLTYKLMLLR